MKIATVTVIDNDILISVEKATYQNVKCIKVNFKKNNSKYKNIEVFEKNNTDQAFIDTKNLIGKKLICLTKLVPIKHIILIKIMMMLKKNIPAGKINFIVFFLYFILMVRRHLLLKISLFWK